MLSMYLDLLGSYVWIPPFKLKEKDYNSFEKVGHHEWLSCTSKMSLRRKTIKNNLFHLAKLSEERDTLSSKSPITPPRKLNLGGCPQHATMLCFAAEP